MEDVTINLSMIGMIISLVMMAVALANMNRAKRDRDDKRMRENIEMSMKLDGIGDGMREIKSDIAKSVEGYNRNDRRITALETSMSNVIVRVGKIEDKILEDVSYERKS